MSNYTNVKEFMQKFGQEVPNEIKIPSVEVRLLRAKLTIEEAFEKVRALGFEVRSDITNDPIEPAYFEYFNYEDPDMVLLLDALVDLDVVGRCGTAIACGIFEECLSEAEEEVSRSNLSKMWSSIEVENYCAQQITKYIFESTGPNTFVAKDKHGKVIKSPSYSPANLKPILEKYGYVCDSD